MKYHGKLPDKNSNVSHDHPLREFLILVTGAAVVLLFVYWLLGLFVDFAVDSMSPQMESAIHQSFDAQLLEKINTNPIADEEGQAAAQLLLTRLTQCLDVGYPVNLTMDESAMINAVALPGGHIVVFAGLLDNLQSQNGLAFVLAHELAHFKNRDHLRSMGRGVLLVVLSALIGGGDSDFLSLMSPFTQLEMAQFSQERERAADITALQILNCHYGHIGGATEFFEAIVKPDGEFDFGLSHYFSSHPQVQERIHAINALGQSMGYKTGETLTRPETDKSSSLQ